MLKSKKETRLINCLVCWTCGGRTNPKHFTLQDGSAVCGICHSKNPLGNLLKMSIQEVTTPSEIIVCFTQGGTAAHALHLDCKTALGPWITFASAETLEKALRIWAQRMNRRQRIELAWGDVVKAAVTSGCCRTARIFSRSTTASCDPISGRHVSRAALSFNGESDGFPNGPSSKRRCNR